MLHRLQDTGALDVLVGKYVRQAVYRATRDASLPDRRDPLFSGPLRELSVLGAALDRCFPENLSEV